MSAGVVREAVLCLGSNIEPRFEYLKRARELLLGLSCDGKMIKSSIRETKPVDVPEEDRDKNFLNQVVIINSLLEVHEFSRKMHGIEAILGRVREGKKRNAARTIDIDLIKYGDIILNEPDLILPHPRAAERKFVLDPLNELGIRL